MVEFETKVSKVIKRNYNVKSFRFKKNVSEDFKAGQFFLVTIKIDGRETSKHFSFSNSPTEKGYIEFTKKITDSEFSKALDHLKAGDWAKIKMPYGSFTLKEGYKKIAFICGGIGITPVRSISWYIADRRLDVDIALLYTSHTADDIVFWEDFDEMQRMHLGLNVTYVISKVEGEWRGRIGHIDGQMIKEEISDYAERRFYVCGPPSFVLAMREILLDEVKIVKENIITENFTGY